MVTLSLQLAQLSATTPGSRPPVIDHLSCCFLRLRQCQQNFLSNRPSYRTRFNAGLFLPFPAHHPSNHPHGQSVPEFVASLGSGRRFSRLLETGVGSPLADWTALPPEPYASGATAQTFMPRLCPARCLHALRRVRRA